jgi:hypothetical protein
MCAGCCEAFQSDDLDAERTAALEAERYAAGLEGVLFRYYACPQCDEAVIFVDVVPLLGESDEGLSERCARLGSDLGDLHGDGVSVVLAGPAVRGRGRRAPQMPRPFGGARPGRFAPTARASVRGPREWPGKPAPTRAQGAALWR